MLSQEANYTAAFMVREKINHFCPLLDAILMMLWHDMANVEIYVSQDFKKELLYLKKKKKKRIHTGYMLCTYMLTFCHTRCNK